MSKLVYYIASSLDGFIARHDGAVSDFPHEGPHADVYRQDLEAFDCVIMGRKTYETGFDYGLEAGQPAYPMMENIICSRSGKYFDSPDLTVWSSGVLDKISNMKAGPGKDIYLCGGGELASYCAHHGLIDEVRVKLVPIILGQGISLFGSLEQTRQLSLQSSHFFGNGVGLLSYIMK